MTNQELKEAMMAEEAVIHNGIEYKCVSAIIYRKGRGETGISISAELLDKTTRSVSIVDSSKVERKSEEE